MTDEPNTETKPPAAIITLDRGAVERTAKGIRSLQQWFEKERDAWRRWDEDDDREQMQENDVENITFTHSGLTAFRDSLASLADVFDGLITQTQGDEK